MTSAPRLGAVAVSLLLASTACAGRDDGVAGSSEPAILIERVDVIDAVNGLRTGMSVLVRGDRIVEVAKADSLAAPDGATVVDGRDRFLIPGLWDAHVHLTFIPELEPAMFPLFIANGITSVRDTGGQLDKVLPWQAAARVDGALAPRVFVAGPLVDGLPRVYDGSGPFRPDISVGVGTAEEAEAQVDALAAAGVDLIKAYELLAPDVYRAVVARAAAHGLPTTGHAPLSMDAVGAAAAGINSMEHMRNLELSCSSEHEVLLAERAAMLAAGADELGGALRGSIHAAQRARAVEAQDDARCTEVVAALLANDTWQVPTLTIVTPQVTRLYARPEWRDTFRYVPEPIRTQWSSSAPQMAAAPRNPQVEAHAAWANGMVARLVEAGVPIMAGTDTPIFFLTPSFSLHEELILLVDAGLTPLQALEAATLRPAQYFDLEDELGTIEAGKAADLVLLDANPLDDIGNTRTIYAVMSRGRLFDRAALDDILAGLAADQQ